MLVEMLFVNLFFFEYEKEYLESTSNVSSYLASVFFGSGRGGTTLATKSSWRLKANALLIARLRNWDHPSPHVFFFFEEHQISFVVVYLDGEYARKARISSEVKQKQRVYNADFEWEDRPKYQKRESSSK